MNMPGFTAESSLYRTSRPYQTTIGFAASSNVIRPQVTRNCDFECLNELAGSCDDLTGSFRLQCIRANLRFCGCVI
jgi:hypothetical protein